MNKIINLRKNSGTKMTVKYLKHSHLLIMHYLSGNPRSTSGPEIRVATQHGLPLIVAKSLREEIRQGILPTIKVVSAILSVYRVLSFKGQLKLETITHPFTGVSTTVNRVEMSLI
jgi:hypothetical protein